MHENRIKKYRWSKYHDPGFEWVSHPDLFRSWNDVLFTNTGKDDALNVKAMITCKPENVKVIKGTVYLGDITAGGSAWSTDFFEPETDMTNPHDPSKGIAWQVEYDDLADEHHIIENAPQFLEKISRYP